jgi:hypothetical protein
MSFLTAFNARGPIRFWSALGNDADGDCVVAGTENIRICQNLLSTSTFKKLLYKIGFRPPHTAYSLELYAEYLATLNEKPSPNTGIDPTGWFEWCKTKGLITAWGAVDIKNQDAVKEAVVKYRGVLLTLELTYNSWRDAYYTKKTWTVGTDKNDQPNPTLNHAVALVDYTPGYFGIVTWGLFRTFSVDYYDACVNGVYWFY